MEYLKPVVFVISHPQRFEANFVLATLMQQGDSQQVLASQSSSAVSRKRAPATNVSRNNNPEPAKNVPKDRDNNADSLDNLDEVFEMEWDNVNDEDINLRTRVSISQREIQATQNKQSGTQGTLNSKRLTQDPVETGIMDSGSRGLMDYSEQEVAGMSNLTTSSVGGISVVYKRCFQATFDPTNLPGFDEILAPDSDEEPD
ncbi:hypothetical protein J437_LFUL005159 [Ladona fulva]|uniref:Uncharacterized protein n=1 Tax=Ladona fulva TaxID=123851 RepID=A0A8K0JXX8_LADFU|nr:hypothetical protein J437_LFUL005159 [Ladona fulva]